MGKLSKKVMVVDDERDLCLLLFEYLRKQSLSVTLANSLQEAVKKIFLVNPAILFLDNNLPDGYGVDFIQTVKKRLPFLKIVMISARHSPEEVQLAHEKGADFFIAKPFSLNSISKTLHIIQNQGGIN